MKAITAYVNGLNLRTIIQELQSLGINEIEVIEYFCLSPKISHLRFLCNDSVTEKVCSVVCGQGATGTACDHCFQMTEIGPERVAGESHDLRTNPQVSAFNRVEAGHVQNVS